jgi:hypothetical protein
MQTQALVEATGAAETLGHIVFPYSEWTPDHYVSIHNNPPGVETERPAIVAHRYGTGRAVYFSAQLGAIYATASYWEARRLIANAVRWAAGTAAPVELDAPLCVELTAWDQPAANRRIVHLVNVQSDIGRTVTIKGDWGKSAQENLHVIQEILPVHDLIVRMKTPAGKQAARAVLQPAGQPLPWTVDGDWLSVQVPRVHVHEAIVWEWR